MDNMASMGQLMTASPMRITPVVDLSLRRVNSLYARNDGFAPSHRRTDAMQQNQSERQWLMQNRPEEARHWNVVTDLQPEHLGYDARTA